MRKLFRVRPEQVLFWWGVLALLAAGQYLIRMLAVAGASDTAEAVRIGFQGDFWAALIYAGGFFLCAAILALGGHVVSTIQAREANR